MRTFFRFHPATQAATPPAAHLLVYDGDCSFCVAGAEFIRKHSRTGVTLVPFSDLPQHDLLRSLDRRQILASAHYITPEGIEYHGGECITRALRLLPGGWGFGLFDLWGLTLVRELAYTLVASNRPVISKLRRRLARFLPKLRSIPGYDRQR